MKKFISVYELNGKELTVYTDFDPGHRYGKVFAGYVWSTKRAANKLSKQYNLPVRIGTTESARRFDKNQKLCFGLFRRIECRARSGR